MDAIRSSRLAKALGGGRQFASSGGPGPAHPPKAQPSASDAAGRIDRVLAKSVTVSDEQRRQTDAMRSHFAFLVQLAALANEEVAGELSSDAQQRCEHWTLFRTVIQDLDAAAGGAAADQAATTTLEP